MKSNLAGLYIQIEAKKRRILENVVNNVPKWATGYVARAPPPAKSSQGWGNNVPAATLTERGMADLH
jgi:hypothetical protein